MPFLELFVTILDIYWWVVVVAILLFWCVQLNVINYSNCRVRGLYDFFTRLTDPSFRFVRRFIKPINGIDLAPLVVLLAIHFAQSSLIHYVAPALIRNGW